MPFPLSGTHYNIQSLYFYFYQNVMLTQFTLGKSGDNIKDRYIAYKPKMKQKKYWAGAHCAPK